MASDKWERVSVDESGCEDTYRMKLDVGWLYRIRQWACISETGAASDRMRLVGMNTVFAPFRWTPVAGDVVKIPALGPGDEPAEVSIVMPDVEKIRRLAAERNVCEAATKEATRLYGSLTVREEMLIAAAVRVARSTSSSRA